MFRPPPISTRPDTLFPSTTLFRPLRQRWVDIAFAVFFTWAIVSSGIADLIPTLGIPITADATNPIVAANYAYGHDADPLFIDPPVWMRFVTGLSRSEEHTSELQSLMRIPYAGFCLQKKKQTK